MIQHHSSADGSPRVLIVEDEFLIRQSLSEAMEDEGYKVTQAESGDQAAQLLRDGAFALLVTDVHLPGAVDGLELARTARKATPALPVIYTSGRPDHGAGPITARDAFIAKPYKPSEVCTAAQHLLDPDLPDHF